MARPKRAFQVDQVTLRMPSDLHRDLAILAERDLRSFNSEMVTAIQLFVDARREEIDRVKASAGPLT